MDRKQQELIVHYRNRIAALDFDERDVLALLILLRNVAEGNEVVFELGSFVAHRQRDRGAFQKFFAASSQAARTTEGLRLGLNAEPLYPAEMVVKQINLALASLGVPGLPEALADELVLCVISLLQDVRFQDKDGAELGYLFLAHNEASVFAIAAVRIAAGKDLQVVPVLKVRNSWLPWHDNEHEAANGKVILVTPNNFLTIERAAGKLRVTSH